MRCFIAIFLFAVLGCAYSASVVCSKYAADATADPDEAARKRLKKHGYYVRPIPKDCKAKRLGGWRPTYRIKEPWKQCKGGWRKYKNACYRKVAGNKGMNFRDAEQSCNRHQGHVVTWKDRAEFMWIHNHIANVNKWHWVGIFCGDGHDLGNMYTVTGEDLRIIGPRWGFRGGHPLERLTYPCYMWLRNHSKWNKQFYRQHCSETEAIPICKVPLV